MTAREDALSQSTVDELWDFDDPAASERHFYDAQQTEDDEALGAELLTQEARAVGLQGRHSEALDLLESVEIFNPAVEVRVLVEQGRVHSSSGRSADAVPIFEEAVKKARRKGLTFLAVDALHMLAICDLASAGEHTREALTLVDQTDDQRTKRWAVSLHNNLGWTLHEQGRYAEALAEFEAAHQASRSYGTAGQELIARWTVARCLRSLGRLDEALAMQRQLVKENPQDPHVHEEISILEAALGQG